ncbi:MAG: hypothetical protein HGA35_06005 [Erysipelotrichaceae bacterium]|nr:hypothetical protein [Erysipelotrichaceae bacterium]
MKFEPQQEIKIIYKVDDPNSAYVYSFNGFWLAPLMWSIIPLLFICAALFSFFNKEDCFLITIGKKITPSEINNISSGLVSYLQNQYVDKYKKDNPSFNGSALLDVMKEQKDPLTALNDTYTLLQQIKRENKDNPTVVNYIDKVVELSFDSNGKFLLNNGFANSLLAHLGSEANVRINFSDKKISTTAVSVDESGNEIFTEVDDYIKQLEGWQSDSMSVLASDKIRPRISNSLRFLDSTGVNLIGMPVYRSYSEVSNLLLNTLAQHRSVEEMINTLASNANVNPFFKGVIAELQKEGNESYRAEFFSSFSNARVTYYSKFEANSKHLFRQVGLKSMTKAIKENFSILFELNKSKGSKYITSLAGLNDKLKSVRLAGSINDYRIEI